MAIPATPALDHFDYSDAVGLRRLLRYQPGLTHRLSKLLQIIGTYLPKGLVRRLMENPTNETCPIILEGTVVFADIDGFTALSEQFSLEASEAGAEEVTELVNRFLELLINAAAPYGGDLHKFGGDAGLLFFTGNDHALRATTAALATQQAMEAMGEIETSLGQFRFQIAIGIASGTLVGVGLGTSMNRKWLLTGAPLQAMGRAQQAAPPGGIVLHSSAYNRCKLAIQCAPISASDLFLVNADELPEVAFDEPAPPKSPRHVDDVEKLNWLFRRLDALSPYLDPELLSRLTALLTLEHFQLWSEHRQVTILMIALDMLPDLSNFRDQPNALQTAVAKPNANFVSARNIIRTYDGIVNKIGIGPQGAYLMALFGAPQAHEDDPLRAVLAALELQERSETPLRIGINTGFVFAGDVGTDERREYTVMGDGVNLAYRLMNSCEPGKIWLGPNTAHHSAVSRRVKTEPGPAQHLKGKQEPIPPFIAQGAQSVITAPEMETLSLIGRETELAALESALEKMGKGTTQIVLLHGPAGSGKSRLIHELTDHQTIHVGTAPSYGAHLPYAAWERPLRALLALDEHPQEMQADALRRVLAAQEQEMWTALIAPLVGLEVAPSPEVEALPPELRETQRQTVLRALLAHCARQHPIILALENAHWMPLPSRRLLEGLMQNPPASSLLLIVTYRDEQGFQETWQPPESAVDLSLAPLSNRAMGVLAQEAAGHRTLPVEVERWIVRRGGGNPLFAIEAIRALQTAGLLAPSNGDWLLTQSLDDAPLPDSTYGLIQNRIDQLEPPSRHLLRAATVVGEQMTVPMLVAGYGEEPRPVVERRLGNLGPLGLNYGDANRETLVFQQPLVREIARRGLPHRIRRAIHHRLAEYLHHQQELATSNWLALLAHHAFEGQAWDVAIQANLDLGKQALDNYLTDQAIQAFTRTLEAVNAVQSSENDLKFQAHHLLGETLAIQGEYEEALRHLTAAQESLLSESRATDHSQHVAHVEYHTASVLEKQGRYQEALNVVKQGLKLQDVRDTTEGARLYLMGAGLYHRLGQLKEFQRWTESCVEILAEDDAPKSRKIKARAFYLLALLALRRGANEEALDLGKQSLNIYKSVADLMGEVEARNQLLLINLASGNCTEAIQHGKNALNIAKRIRHRAGEARIAANLGEVYRYLGEWRQARNSYSLALEIAKEHGITYGIALMENNLAALDIKEGNLSEARRRLDKAQNLIEEIGSEAILAELYRHRGALCLAEGQLDKASEWLKRSLECAKAQENHREIGRTQRLLAKAHLQHADYPEALNALHKAEKYALEQQDRFGLAQTLMTRARYHHQLGESVEALSQIDQAIQVFEILGAQHELDRAKQLHNHWQH